MDGADNEHNNIRVYRRGRRRMALECRECGRICERVVWPLHCLRSGCPYVYSYHEGDTTYFGCLYKVFSAEIDMSVFSEALAGGVSGHDPYGPIRMVRPPRRQCRVSVEPGYERHPAAKACTNRGFLDPPHRRGG